MTSALSDSVFGVIGSAGVAGIWLLCIMLGYMVPKQHADDLKQQNAEKDAIIATERQRADNERARADAAVVAANTANILLAALRTRAGSDEVASS